MVEYLTNNLGIWKLESSLAIENCLQNWILTTMYLHLRNLGNLIDVKCISSILFSFFVFHFLVKVIKNKKNQLSCLFIFCTKNPHFAWKWQLIFSFFWSLWRNIEWTRHLPSKAFWSHRAEILALGTNSVKILRVNECRFCTFGDIVASRRWD